MANIKTIIYEDESEIECEVIGTFTIDNDPTDEDPSTTYVAVTPTDEDSEDVYIFIYDPETHEVTEIEDDEEFEAASAEFEAILESYDEPDDDPNGEEEGADPDDTESDEDAPE